MDNVDAFSQHDVAEYREERKDCWEGRRTVYNHEGNMVDLESICEIADAGSAFIGVCDDDHLVASIDELVR